MLLDLRSLWETPSPPTPPTPFTLTRDESIPLEWVARLARDEAIPIEWLQTLARLEAIPVEWRAALARDESIPIEWRQTLSRLESIPVEWRGALARDEAIPIEWQQILARLESIPVEWRATGVVSIQLSRDESIPVDFSLSRPVLLFFNWLAGGGGAPWPPAWLRPANLLAHERGLGRVWWTGWSKAQWVPAPPLARARLVAHTPRARPVRRRPPAHHREVSYATGLWAGRSREVFRPSVRAIAADDDDLLLMLRLLRG